MSYPAISLTTATVGRHRHPQKRLQTAADPASTRIRAPTIHVCYFLSPLPVSSPRPSLSIGGFGLSIRPQKEGVDGEQLRGKPGLYLLPRAWIFMSKGAWDNPECENTAVVAELDGETMVFRIFRQRHTGDKNPLVEADQWVRQVKKHCASISGELAATAVWTDADGGSVLVAITGQGIIANSEPDGR